MLEYNEFSDLFVIQIPKHSLRVRDIYFVMLQQLSVNLSWLFWVLTYSNFCSIQMSSCDFLPTLNMALVYYVNDLWALHMAISTSD